MRNFFKTAIIKNMCFCSWVLAKVRFRVKDRLGDVKVRVKVRIYYQG